MSKLPIAKPYLTADEAQGAYDVILTNWVTQGPKVQEFEEKFAAYVGSKYAVAVSNCTTALHLAMIVAGVKEGDEVICPSMSYIATANSVKYAGAKPVFAEVGPDYNIDIEHVKALITPKTKAILIVHQIGIPSDIDAYSKLCKEKNLVLIEDAACAAGSSYKGKKIGSHSDLVCFSFHPRKVITTGDGGMISTNREDYSTRLKLLRQHGMSVNDRVRHASDKIIFEEHVEVGYNYRMTDIQAAVGIKQLEKLDMIVEARRKIAERYNEAFKNIPQIELYKENTDHHVNYQSYVIFIKPGVKLTRNAFMEAMNAEGVSTRRGVMTTHREPAYEKECKGLKLPKSEFYSDNSVVLPLFYPMTNEEIERVISTVRKIFNAA